YPLALHAALPICEGAEGLGEEGRRTGVPGFLLMGRARSGEDDELGRGAPLPLEPVEDMEAAQGPGEAQVEDDDVEGLALAGREGGGTVVGIDDRVLAEVERDAD